MSNRCPTCGHRTDRILPWVLHGLLILSIGWWSCGGTIMAILAGEWRTLLITVPALVVFYALLELIIHKMDYCTGCGIP